MTEPSDDYTLSDAAGEAIKWRDELLVVRTTMSDALQAIKPQDGENDEPLRMLWGCFTVLYHIEAEMAELADR